MSQLTKPLALALALGLAQGAWAQDTTATPDTAAPAASGETAVDGATAPAPEATTEAPAPDAAANGQPAPDATVDGATAPQPAAPAQPQSYTKGTYGDWELQCIKAPDGKDPCQIYQVIKNNQGGNVADISLFGLPKGGKAVAGATIMVPLDTLLTQNLLLSVDGAKPQVYPFTFCQPMGCFARIGLTQEDLDSFKKGNKATITIVPLAAPTEKVSATISLSGFTAGFDAVVKANEESGAVK